jgi:FSR family fosmidomycin resistance protein-like MFS transporter
MQNELDRRGISLLALGHLLNDVNQGAIPALLPFLITRHGLSYTAASGVVVASTAISAITQPLLGYYSDRHSFPWLIPLGMLLGGAGIALSGIMPTYWLVIACVLISGLGVAAFHPEGYRFANYVAGKRHSVGISIFTVGGNLGVALGPILITFPILAFGLTGTLAMAIPAAIYAILLWKELPRFISFHPDNRKHQETEVVRVTDWQAFIRLTMIVILRAVMGYGLLIFIPLYLIKIRQIPIAHANSSLTILSASIATGTMLSGYLSDRFGKRLVLGISMASITPFVFLFLKTGEFFGIMSLIVMGVGMGISFTVAVVMGQIYAEADLGVASGITTGFAIGIGGMSSSLLGMLADKHGLETVMVVIAVIPMLGAIITMTLPRVGKR